MMKKNNKVNRRQFLASASSAVGFAAVVGPALSEDRTQKSGAAVLASDTSQNPQERAASRPNYSSSVAGQVAFPLGGIGTGSVSIGGRGELRDWEIFNRPAKRRNLPFTFVALWTKSENEHSLLRVVEGPIEPPYTGWNGYSRESGQGLPHFEKATFTGRDPIASVDFEDRALPVTVSLEAFTPFVPLNVDDSSIPVIIFNYYLTNRSQKAADVALAFSLMNPVGYDGKASLDSHEFPGFGKNVNTLLQEQVAGTKLAGIDLTSTKYSEGDLLHGSMALLTTHPTFTARTAWPGSEFWDFVQTWFSEFSAGGKFQDSSAKPTADGESCYTTLAPYAHLEPGQSTTISFVMAWHFPLRENYWHYKDAEIRGKTLTNYYGTRFKNAWDVAVHTAYRLPELGRKTRLFSESFFSSTLPAEVLQAVASQASIMRTNTCILLEGKQFFGFEGCGDDEANGWMNCSHVWNYEQAVAFLFPELERSMRETDFLHELRADDSLAFRATLPLGSKLWDFRPAADGQMGCILRLYREWQISGDDAFLKKMWPNAKRALEFSWKFWDVDKDGLIEGEQHNTYDIEFFGPNPMVTSLYLGALKAGELMATAVGDANAAQSYREVREKGAKNFESMWNGEFYMQKTTPVDQIRPMPPYDKDNWKERVVQDGQLKYQFGAGCASDQLLGQWYADILGLDLGLRPENVRKALQSVYRHNFRKEFWDYPNTQRIYAINDDQGLLMCSWPNGGRPALPLVYGDEVWTGVEYAVAAQLIYAGLIAEGLNLVNAINGRYDGVRRNPWNQIEWGNHYSRAMASYSLLLALSGFHYSAVEKKLAFRPAMQHEAFRCFFAAGTAWGSYRQDGSGSLMNAKLQCQHGSLALKHLSVGNSENKTAFTKAALTGPGGRQVRCALLARNGLHEIELMEELTLREGESISVTLN